MDKLTWKYLTSVCTPSPSATWFSSRSWYFHFHFIYFYCLVLIFRLISTNLHQLWPHQLSLQLQLWHSINVPHPIRADHISAEPTGFSHWLEWLFFCLLPSNEVVDPLLQNPIKESRHQASDLTYDMKCSPAKIQNQSYSGSNLQFS